MGLEKLYDYLPKSKEGRTFIGLFLIVLGLFTSGSILAAIIMVPLGIVILAYDYEWARNILRKVRDWLNGVREDNDKKDPKRS